MATDTEPRLVLARFPVGTTDRRFQPFSPTSGQVPVSYTHLDVYKRQRHGQRNPSIRSIYRLYGKSLTANPGTKRVIWLRFLFIGNEILVASV